MRVLAHPPYSPNLTPRDFRLFPLITEKLAVWNFFRIQDLGPHKSKFRAPGIVSSRLLNCLRTLAQTIGGECAKRRRVL